MGVNTDVVSKLCLSYSWFAWLLLYMALYMCNVISDLCAQARDHSHNTEWEVCLNGGVHRSVGAQGGAHRGTQLSLGCQRTVPGPRWGSQVPRTHHLGAYSLLPWRMPHPLWTRERKMVIFFSPFTQISVSLSEFPRLNDVDKNCHHLESMQLSLDSRAEVGKLVQSRPTQ